MDMRQIPPPITFQDPGSITHERVVTLVYPWRHALDQRAFIAINQLFKNINTFSDLVSVWRNNQPIERLGDDGSIAESIQEFKLLSLRSIMA